MATNITQEHLGQIYHIWTNTSLGRQVQQSGNFQTSTEWWAFLSKNSGAFLGTYGLFQIIKEGNIAKVDILPFELGDHFYNALLEEAVQTAFEKGFSQVLANVKRIELVLFHKQEEPTSEAPIEDSENVTGEENNGKLQSGTRLAESNNGKLATASNSKPKFKNKVRKPKHSDTTSSTTTITQSIV